MVSNLSLFSPLAAFNLKKSDISYLLMLGLFSQKYDRKYNDYINYMEQTNRSCCQLNFEYPRDGALCESFQEVSVLKPVSAERLRYNRSIYVCQSTINQLLFDQNLWKQKFVWAKFWRQYSVESILWELQGSLLQTWVDFNPNMDK